MPDQTKHVSPSSSTLVQPPCAQDAARLERKVAEMSQPARSLRPDGITSEDRLLGVDNFGGTK